MRGCSGRALFLEECSGGSKLPNLSDDMKDHGGDLSLRAQFVNE